MKVEALEDIVRKAWAVREDMGNDTIYFAVPGAKFYFNRFFSNKPFTFVHFSVTGGACALHCAHCNGTLLQTMIPANTPDTMNRLIDCLIKKGCQGILVSGGSNSNGEVPLLPFVETIRYAKKSGLQVLVHGGLIQRETALALKEAGVDQVLLDIIGHADTIREVYHLNYEPDDYLKLMQLCQEIGLAIAPHVVIGLHFGRILGEIKALQMISKVKPDIVVLVVLTPSANTAMADVEPPPIEEVASVIGTARLMNPTIPLNLGCARPAGKYKREIERLAVDCGVNAVAYPHEATVLYARKRGLKTIFCEECCSLVSRNFPNN